MWSAFVQIPKCANYDTKPLHQLVCFFLLKHIYSLFNFVILSLLEVNLIEILKYSRVTEVVVPKDNKSSQRKALCMLSDTNSSLTMQSNYLCEKDVLLM